MVSYKRNTNPVYDYSAYLELRTICSNNLGGSSLIYICVRGLRTGVAAPGPLSFLFNKPLTFALKAWYNIIEHLREIQYENQDTLQTRRFQTQSRHTFDVWIRLSTFGNFQPNNK